MPALEDLEDFAERPDDDELLLEEFDMLELRPEREAGLSVTVDAVLRAGTPEVELWLHQPAAAPMSARLMTREACELGEPECQAADVENAMQSFERWAGCDGRGVVPPAMSRSVSAAKGDGGFRSPAAATNSD